MDQPQSVPQSISTISDKPRQPLQSISTNTFCPPPPPPSLPKSSGALPVPVRKKRGPKPKPLAERLAIQKPVKRAIRTYSREKKTQAITFLLHHKVPRTLLCQRRRREGASEADDSLGADLDAYRDVTLTEASEFFKIPASTLSRWWVKRHSILAGKPRRRG